MKSFQVRGEDTARGASYTKLKNTQITGRPPWWNLPYGDRSALHSMYYGACTYKTYVIPVSVMTVCWIDKRKLIAGAGMLTAGEQLCRRVVSTQKRIRVL